MTLADIPSATNSRKTLFFKRLLICYGRYPSLYPYSARKTAFARGSRIVLISTASAITICFLAAALVLLFSPGGIIATWGR